MRYNYLLSLHLVNMPVQKDLRKKKKGKKLKKRKKKKKSFKKGKEISKHLRLLWLLLLTVLAFAKCNEYCFFFPMVF